MSETLISLSNPYEGRRKPGTVGHPVPGYEVRVVGDDGEPIDDERAGELWVRGPGVMRGYWRRPDATAEVFADGWLRTGDVVARDRDGYFAIVGRRSVDIIKSGGFKIAAGEIEAVLRRHPVVVDAAVVGVPDERWGERIAAAVVVRSRAPAHDWTRALGEFVATHLADYKQPRQVVVLDSIPTNALGKVQKHLLRPLFG